jgi:hypothetical protein
MRSGYAGALVWRLLDRRLLATTTPTSRVLKNLRQLVVVQCAAKGHALAMVYKLPTDATRKMLEAERLSFIHGGMLFVSTDNQRFEPGQTTIHEPDGTTLDPGDLTAVKSTRDRVIPNNRGRPPTVVRVGSTRKWTPLVDLLDHDPDDDQAHARLVTRCRCGERPEIDRRELIDLARVALDDGKVRRVFV